jgi:hypothetical protein
MRYSNMIIIDYIVSQSLFLRYRAGKVSRAPLLKYLGNASKMGLSFLYYLILPLAVLNRSYFISFIKNTIIIIVYSGSSSGYKGENILKLFFPVFLALYIARSANFIISSDFEEWSGYTAIPMLAPTWIQLLL